MWLGQGECQAGPGDSGAHVGEGRNRETKRSRWVTQKMEMHIKTGSRKGQARVGWDGGPRGCPFRGSQAQPDANSAHSLLDRFPASFGHRQSASGVQYSRIEVSAAS